jgi:cytochrome P450
VDAKLNLTDATFLSDRRQSYRMLRNQEPVALSDLNGEEVIVLSRYRDVDSLLQNRHLRVQPADNEFPARIGTGAAALFYRLSTVSLDAPDHTRLRSLLAPLLSTSNVSKMETWMKQIIARRLDEVGDKQIIDVVAQFGKTIPADVTCQLLHIPRPDVDLLVNRADDLNVIFSQSDLDADTLKRADNAGQFFFDYFDGLLKNLNDLPEDDFIGALVRAEQRGQMTREEMISAIIDVFVGSYHTTMVALTNAINALALFPEQRAMLTAQPGLAARAWEEVLRFDPPAHFRHRYVSEPVSIQNVKINPRVRILLGLASANWDETVFDQPDVFNISRPAVRHLTFGGSGHFCLGAQLSRLEGRLFLAQFVARYSEFTLINSQVPRITSDLTFVYATRLEVQLSSPHLKGSQAHER